MMCPWLLQPHLIGMETAGVLTYSLALSFNSKHTALACGHAHIYTHTHILPQENINVESTKNFPTQRPWAKWPFSPGAFITRIHLHQDNNNYFLSSYHRPWSIRAQWDTRNHYHEAPPPPPICNVGVKEKLCVASSNCHLNCSTLLLSVIIIERAKKRGWEWW